MQRASTACCEAAVSAGSVTTRLQVGGMTCQNCARHVTEALRSVPGIAEATVDLETGAAVARWNSTVTANESQLIDAVARAGFEARMATHDAPHVEASPWSPLSGWQFNVLVGGVVTLVLMVGEWGFSLGNLRWFHWLSFGLALPVQLICGARFYRGAWNQLRVGSANMDALVALGSTTAFGFSLWGLLAGGLPHLYFMESSAIITLISLGHWMEARVSARAADALQALLHLAPPTARRLDEAGMETEVPAADLKVHDRVVLKPGDRVPTDGLVREGASTIDESMLTGESVPVDKNPGDALYGGTVNQQGRLVVEVAATGEATALAQIIAVVKRAQSSRANIQRLGDGVSSVFVPLVVLVAIGTALGWGLAPESARQVHAALAPWLWPAHLPEGALACAFVLAAGVLIVACPCAMGLATPAAIMAGTNAAARRGILIRDGLALEKSGRITAVVFDKTGTLTVGQVSVAAVEDLRPPHLRPVSLEAMAAAVAQPSSHPLSRAVAQLVAKPEAAAEWQELRGLGVQGRIKANHGATTGVQVQLGALRWLQESGVDLAPAERFLAEWSNQGATLLGLAAEGRLIGLLALRDRLKPQAEVVVRQLEQSGLPVYLITGDHALTAAAVARQAGIAAERVYAEIRPDQKAAILQQLQQRGERVAFVGDGINDAPALEQADLGVAVSRASDVAREAADLILLKSDIQAIPEALGLAQATLRVIHQNLFWAFFYNAAAVPLAALGFLSPVLCAAAMGFSDLIVIGNALRLRRWKYRGGLPR